MTNDPAPRAGRREWIGLAVLALPTFLVSIDVFVLLLALPHLSSDLGASSTQQLWITDIYGFVLAGFMITMGTLGDRIGRRRLLLIGAFTFGVASVLAAYSGSPEMLIATRALLGVAGATLMPSTLALISTMFTDPRQRGLAISVWMVCFMGGATVGPLIGGTMLEHFWWGSVFLLGVPVMVLLLVTGPALLPEYRDPSQPARLDMISVVLSLAAILPFVYGLKELAAAGWTPQAATAMAVGIASGLVFVRRQRRLTSPLLDLRLFGNRSFSVALSAMLLGTLTMGAMMLFTTQYLQLVAGLSPLGAGLWMVPAMIGSIVGSLAAPLIARRVRPAYVIGGGLVVSVAGLVSLTQVGGTSGLATVVLGFTLINLGSGPLVALGTDLIIGSAPAERAGSAASMSEVSGEFGYALGIAIIGSLGALVYRSEIARFLPTGTPAEASDSLAGATVVADALPAQLAAGLLAPARDAFTSGMHLAAVVSATLLACVAVAVAVLLRQVSPSTATPADADTSPDPAADADQPTMTLVKS